MNLPDGQPLLSLFYREQISVGLALEHLGSSGTEMVMSGAFVRQKCKGKKKQQKWIDISSR